MKKLLYLSILFMLIFSCKKEEKANKIVDSKINVTTYNYKDLKPLLNQKEDKVYVVNFWATWCKPCVDELPAFENITANYKKEDVEVLLVSLDFPKQIDKRLKPFISKKNIKSDVVVLDDDDQQFWINDISEEWSGAIPATIIYRGDKRKFYETSFEYETLNKEIQTFLN